MTRATPSQIQRIDQALLALVDERARLLAADVGANGSSQLTNREDVLRRYAGVLTVEDVHAVLDAVDRACGAGRPS